LGHIRHGTIDGEQSRANIELEGRCGIATVSLECDLYIPYGSGDAALEILLWRLALVCELGDVRLDRRLRRFSEELPRTSGLSIVSLTLNVERPRPRMDFRTPAQNSAVRTGGHNHMVDAMRYAAMNGFRTSHADEPEVFDQEMRNAARELGEGIRRDEEEYFVERMQRELTASIGIPAEMLVEEEHTRIRGTRVRLELDGEEVPSLRSFADSQARRNAEVWSGAWDRTAEQMYSNAANQQSRLSPELLEEAKRLCQISEPEEDPNSPEEYDYDE